MLAVALALLREPCATRPRSLLLMEVASLPAVPVADLREVVEVPEALLPEEAAALLRLTVDSEERRVVPDCWAALWLAPELRLTVDSEDLLVVPDCCWAEERLDEPEDC